MTNASFPPTEDTFRMCTFHEITIKKFLFKGHHTWYDGIYFNNIYIFMVNKAENEWGKAGLHCQSYTT